MKHVINRRIIIRTKITIRTKTNPEIAQEQECQLRETTVREYKTATSCNTETKAGFNETILVVNNTCIMLTNGNE